MKSLPSDERRTPRAFFELVNRCFGPVDLDACAAKWNAVVARYVTKREDIFAIHPKSSCCWRNPPYSRGNLYRHLTHARAKVLDGTVRRYLLLVPADTSTAWWHDCIMRPEGAPLGSEFLWRRHPEPLGNGVRFWSDGLQVTVLFVSGRLAFDSPGETQKAGAKQPSALVVFERPAVVWLYAGAVV